jgi:hypothetical protein
MAREELFPPAGRGEQLQSNGERIRAEEIAVDYTGPGPEIPWGRPQVQPVIQLPRFAGNDARTVSAHILCNAFLGTKTDIQAAKIHPYGKWKSFFKPASNCLHETPQCPGRD